ncbi:hypothetical protein CC80DRAFT_299239 [Byssothecium circinans]|uniref:Uncharacterized protein n=1 Tax=Byssothecium circinans TaxID=147558 RepID=A0A6A5T8Z0_9PLEO|nr:hypothetical protein CC80DRAFT_299239 [Byssothecium circinans]
MSDRAHANASCIMTDPYVSPSLLLRNQHFLVLSSCFFSRGGVCEASACIVRYDTVWCGAVRCGAVRCGAP